MSDYKRLTNEELNDFTQRVVVQLEPNLTQQVMSIIYELLQYREKIENGTVIELPCKVGDTVYYETFINGESKGIIPHKVIGFVLEAMTQNMDGFGCTSVPIRDFGKDVFLTKAEAVNARKSKEKEILKGAENGKV